MEINRNKLHLTAISLLILGFFIWSITPFIANDQDSLNHRLVRYSSLIISLSCGSLALHCGLKLDKDNKIHQATIKSQDDIKYHSLATEQYLEEKRLELIASYQLQEFQQELLPSRPVTDETPINQEVTELQLHSNQLVDRNLVTSVTNAINDGLSDSKIIKEVLGMTGRNYQDGKTLLSQIKKLINEV